MQRRLPSVRIHKLQNVMLQPAHCVRSRHSPQILAWHPCALHLPLSTTSSVTGTSGPANELQSSSIQSSHAVARPHSAQCRMYLHILTQYTALHRGQRLKCSTVEDVSQSSQSQHRSHAQESPPSGEHNSHVRVGTHITMRASRLFDQQSSLAQRSLLRPPAHVEHLVGLAGCSRALLGDAIEPSFGRPRHHVNRHPQNQSWQPGHCPIDGPTSSLSMHGRHETLETCCEHERKGRT